MNRIFQTFLILAAAALVSPAQDAPGKARSPGEWPQWRGPSRDNISTETGLLQAWPEGGPPLHWEVNGIGGGIAAVSVSGGRVFAMGYIGDGEYLSALDEETGERRWTAKIGPAVQENPLMRWLGQRTPTVDGNRVYAFHTQGNLVCLDSATGKELWRKDYVREFETRTHFWGICDRPLVDGENLILTPGGRKTSMVAVRKTTGEVLWKSESKGTAAWSSTLISNAAGVRQYVTCLEGKVVSFRASDGKHLWTHEDFGRTANSCTPIAAGDDIVATAGFGVGLALLRISASGAGLQAQPQYTQRLDVSPFQDSAVLNGPYLYLVGGGTRSCVELSSGKVLWKDHSTGKGLASMTYADGRLYVHHSEGALALAEATPEKLSVCSTVSIQPWQPTMGASNPVVAGGRLYVRNENRLLSYEIHRGASDHPRPKAIVLPDPLGKAEAPNQAIYVPTPPDVVDRMLGAAHLTPCDTVYDLGSGDGRILVAAAKKHGARALGYEIDPKLVRESRANIEKAGIKDLASVEEADLFKANLKEASVVALYLPEKFLERLVPLFATMEPGSLIISHQFKIPGFAPDQAIEVQSKDDGDLHRIFIWKTPLRKDGK
jgi:outer membrane protein assembly factor BamB